MEFQCIDCESWAAEAEWARASAASPAGCCPVCGEGQSLEFAPRRDAEGRLLPSLDELEDLRERFPGLADMFVRRAAAAQVRVDVAREHREAVHADGSECPDGCGG